MKNFPSNLRVYLNSACHKMLAYLKQVMAYLKGRIGF